MLDKFIFHTSKMFVDSSSKFLQKIPPYIVRIYMWEHLLWIRYTIFGVKGGVGPVVYSIFFPNGAAAEPVFKKVKPILGSPVAPQKKSLSLGRYTAFARKINYKKAKLLSDRFGRFGNAKY